METKVIHKQPDMKCPLCGAPVKKVTETDAEEGVKVKCENEYYRHYGDSIVKFLTPRVSAPEVRFNY